MMKLLRVYSVKCVMEATHNRAKNPHVYSIMLEEKKTHFREYLFYFQFQSHQLLKISDYKA